MKDLLHKFQSLTWIPGGLYCEKAYGISRQAETYRRLYLENGWPDEFDLQGFQSALAAWEDDDRKQYHAERPFDKEKMLVGWAQMNETHSAEDRLAQLETEVLTTEFKRQFADPEGSKIEYESRKKALQTEIQETAERREQNLKNIEEAREEIRKLDPAVVKRREERIAKWGR